MFFHVRSIEHIQTCKCNQDRGKMKWLLVQQEVGRWVKAECACVSNKLALNLRFLQHVVGFSMHAVT